MKKILFILLICFGINSLHSGELRGKTPDSELFAIAVYYGDYYLCKSLLNDPEVDINLVEDFNDNIFRYVFNTSLNVDHFVYNSAESYYISKERIKIFTLLLSNNLSLDNVRVWDYFPVIWSSEAHELAETIYQLKPFKSSDRWIEKASSISEKYRSWIKGKGVDVDTPDNYPEVAMQSMDKYSDTQLMESFREETYYGRISALEEVRARCANKTFTLHEELYNHTVKLRGIRYTQYDVRKLESTLFLLNDKRIIPQLLYDSYLAVYEQNRYFYNSYLIKILDHSLYTSLKKFLIDPDIYSEKKVTVRRLLSTELLPYFNNKASMEELMESGISDEIYPLILDYFLRDDHFRNSIENQLSSLGKRLEIENRDEKNKIIYTLSAFKKGREVLINYLFKTKDSLEFLKIYNYITLEDTPENRKKVKSSLKKWKGIVNQPVAEDVISLHYKILFSWSDKSVIDYIDKDSQVGKDCLENAFIVLKVEGDNGWNIFKEHLPIDPERFGYYGRIELYPYKRFSYGHDGSNINDLRKYHYYTVRNYKNSHVKESYPFIEELKGIKEYQFPLDIIKKDTPLVLKQGLKKDRNYNFYSEGIILLEAGEKVELKILDLNREVIGTTYLENIDSVTCWRSFRIETNGIIGTGKDMEFYIVSDNKNELIVPELEFYMKHKK